MRSESCRSLVCWASESLGRFDEAFGRSFSFGAAGGLRVSYIGSRTRCPRRKSLGGRDRVHILLMMFEGIEYLAFEVALRKQMCWGQMLLELPDLLLLGASLRIWIEGCMVRGR